jgi:hypothetical protein
MATTNGLRDSVVLIVICVLSGCAHVPKIVSRDLPALFEQACEPGSRIQSVEGSVWLKANSKEASGQFPAAVRAIAPSQLILEVTNLLGGTEAVITVDEQHYRISMPNGQRPDEEGYHSWGGIPLFWATELFLGRIPCPSGDAARDAVLSLQEDDLVVETHRSVGRDVERFVYSFRKWAGKPWPESLHWERTGTFPLTVDFKFEDPDDATHSPKKWEARSIHGEVKVRWRDREPVQSAVVR